MSKEKLLTPSQMKVKKPRVVNYSNDIYKQQYGRDIITLYVACGLGYSPIRHILGLRNDKLIELGQDPISIDDYMEILLGSLISDQLNK